MTEQQVTWSRTTNFTGRNGFFQCSGLDIQPLEHNESVMIAPLTSQGIVGRCDIEIPLEALPELVARLQSFITQVRKNRHWHIVHIRQMRACKVQLPP